jgi:hypothetical protein
LEGGGGIRSEETGRADLCYKISPKAYSRAGFSPRGYQISYTRSNCFYQVALKTQNRQLCEKVITYETSGCVDGSKISQDECLNDITKNERSSAPLPDAELILRFLGYTEEDFKNDRFNKDKDFFDLYLKTRNTSHFLEKLVQLPDFSTSDHMAIEQIRLSYPQCASNYYDNPLCRCINRKLVRDGVKDAKCKLVRYIPN